MGTNEIEAIKALRARDEAASMAGDFTTLRSIMSDDAVVLSPGSNPQVGREALDAAFRSMAQMPRTYEVLEYRFELSEPEISGNLAIEYGAVVGKTRQLSDGALEESRYHVMRVLRKEADGQWRVYRSIWAPGV